MKVRSSFSRGPGGRAAIAAAFVLIAAAGIAADRFIFFVSDPKTATYNLTAAVPADALFFKDYDQTPYTDSLYYQFDNADGSDFFCHVFMVDLGLGLKRFGIDYKLKKPDGKKVYFGGKQDVKDSTMAKDRFAWKVGPNRVSGDFTSHHLVLDEGPLKIDVTLKTVVPFYRVGDKGQMCITEKCEKQGVITYFPLFAVTGQIKEGSTVTKVNGWGYGNRLWQTFMFDEMSTFHTALRWQKDGVGFDLHDYVTSEKLGAEWLGVLMLYKDGKLIHVAQNYKKENLEFYEEPKSKKKIPTSYRVTSEGQGVKVTIEFTGVKLTDYNDPLLSLGPIEKKLLSYVVEAPLDLRFEGQVKLTITTPEGVIVKEGPGHGLALMAL